MIIFLLHLLVVVLISTASSIGCMAIPCGLVPSADIQRIDLPRVCERWPRRALSFDPFAPPPTGFLAFEDCVDRDLLLMTIDVQTNLNSLPDELLLRVFALIATKPSWLDPTHARPDMLAEDELETAVSLARLARVSRRFCRLVDSYRWVVIDGVGAGQRLRERPVERLAVHVYDKAQLTASACSDPWLKNQVTAATVTLQYPFQRDWPIEPFPVPELYGFALRELNLLGGETSCIEGSWLEP